MAVTLFALGCGGAGGGDATGPPPTSPPVLVSGVAITPATLKLMMGDTSEIAAVALDADGATISGKSASWTSDAVGVVAILQSDATKATVRASGVGTAHVTATIDGKYATASITVNAPPPSSVPVAAVQMNPSGLTLDVDRTSQIWATPVDAQGTPLAGRVVTWSSSDAAVASVSDKGMVTAHKAGGPLTVTATSEGKVGRTSVTVVDPTTVRYSSVTLGTRHSCALSTSGDAYCWGEIVREPYNEPHGGSVRPVLVGGGHHFVMLNAGDTHTCGLDTGGQAFCWGYNFAGELGDRSTNLSADPIRVSTTIRFSTLSAGQRTTCGLTAAGAAYCWGRNQSGQMGTGSQADEVATPAASMLGLTLSRLSVGGAHICGVTQGGEGYCAGYNYFGQLGDGTTTNKSSPVKTGSETQFRSVRAGSNYTCAIGSDDGAYCWGTAQRAMPDVGDRTAPIAVPAGGDYVSIAVGGDHTCALTAAGTAYCWGENSSGQLGNGTWSGDGQMGLQTKPLPVTGGLTFVSISVGDMQSCGITDAGRLYCWGENEWGQVGDGTTTDRNRPFLVANPETP